MSQDHGSGSLKDWLNQIKGKEQKRDKDKEDLSRDEIQPQHEDGSTTDESTDTFTTGDVPQEQEKENAQTVLKEEPREKDARTSKDIQVKEANLPKSMYAHFMLIYIGGSEGVIRGLPRYLEVKGRRTLIGRHAKAHVRLDDRETIAAKHAKLLFEDFGGKKEFVVYPINQARVSLNGIPVTEKGVALRNGDRVQMGSADLIFFYKDMGEEGV